MYIVSYRRPYTNELYHYGIKGQRWGVRRFQNTNGTLTAAGKLRYKNGSISPSGASGSATKKPVASFKDGAKTYTKYSDGTVTGYDSSTGGYFNVSKEYFEAISGITDEKSSAPASEINTELASAEYRNELMYNSRKNVYPEQSVKEFSKNNKERKRAIERFIDKVKVMAKKVADVAKSAFNAAKDLVSGLFSKKPKAKTSAQSKTRSSGTHEFTFENGRTVYKGRT